MSEHRYDVPFMSSIKVKGIHLLPPVMTQKRRAEVQGYKQQAVKLEKRLKNCRDLKKNLEDLLNMQSLTQRPYSEISFGDGSHVEALGITKDTNDNCVSSKINHRNYKLSQDIIDVTQYDKDGIKVLFNDRNGTITHHDNHLTPCNGATLDTSFIQSSQIDSLLEPTNNQNCSRDCSNVENCDLNLTLLVSESLNGDSLKSDSPVNISSTLERSPRPRLIRSNSYTLDTPSPILLAHLEKTEKSNKHKVQNIEEIKNLAISRNWSSVENTYMPFEKSEFSSINTVYNTNFNQTDSDEMQSSTAGLKDEPTIRIQGSASPTIKVIQTDISVQNITVNANDDILNDASNESFQTSDSQLIQLLKTLPDDYAKQIIELIESQRNKQSIDQNAHKNNNEFVGDKASKNNEHGVTSKNDIFDNPTLNRYPKSDCRQNSIHHSLSGSDKLQGSTTSISPSQSVYYSVTSSDTLRPLSNCSVRLVDFECDDVVISNENSESPRKTDNVEFYIYEEIKKKMNVSRELFPQLDENTIISLKKDWAASIIGAHVRGYLTRRLLKTERVQSLIETIKDALMCALQLHNSENIDESDVELHRRLINQVSAACYTFHDIFFALSVQEQMLMISTDRQRKLEKAKRPSSAPVSQRSKSSSNRSTPSQQRVPSHTQSLTKV